MVKDGEVVEEVFRVAVVGGGLAGISAARRLSSHFGKERVVLLEAASSLGGRIKNVPGLAPWPVEIGPEFLHGARNSSVKDIADVMGCVQRELNFPDYYYIGHEHRLLSSQAAAEHPDVRRVHEIFTALVDEDSSVPDTSMAEYLRLKGVNDTVVQLSQSIYGNDFGCSLDKLGVHECIQEAQQWIYGDTYIILDRPLSSIVDYLSQDVNVRLNWVVGKVDHGANDMMQLHSQDGRVVKANYIVVSVPLAVLQQGHIAFHPPLPDWKLEAICAIGMSNVVKAIIDRRFGFTGKQSFVRFRCGIIQKNCKVILIFNYKFWLEDIFDVVCSGCFLPEIWITEYPPSPSPLKRHEPLGRYSVVGFIAGEAANALAQLPESEIFRKALAQVDAMFGSTGSCAGISKKESLLDSHPWARNCLENASDKELNGVDDYGSRCARPFEESEFPRCKFCTRDDLLRTSEPEDRYTHPASFYFQGGMIVNWAEQSFIQGGYSHPSINANGARDMLSKPVNDIHFAGEATHPGVNPCLQAAFDTGQRAALQVIAASSAHSGS